MGRRGGHMEQYADESRGGERFFEGSLDALGKSGEVVKKGCSWNDN